MEIGSLDNTVVWTCGDLNPFNFVVFLDGEMISSGPWNGSDIMVDVDALGVGTYNLTLTVYDSSGNQASSTVSVIIQDTTAPEIIGPESMQLAEGVVGVPIQWEGNDIYPWNYTILLEGKVQAEGIWNSTGEFFITYTVDHSLGIFNYTIVLSDQFGNIAHNTVLLTVYDGTSPTVNEPSDIEYSEMTTGHFIIWNGSDAHPLEFIILRNGTEIDSGPWSGESIVVNVDGLAFGVWNYTAVLIDVGGNRASDTALITIIDTTAPSSIEWLSNYEVEAGTEHAWVNLTLEDYHPSRCMIQVNGSIEYDGIFTSGIAIELDIGPLDLGIHNVTATATDESGNSIMLTLWITASDNTAPTIDLLGDIDSELGIATIIVWTLSDTWPWDFEGIYQIRVNGSFDIIDAVWNSSTVMWNGTLGFEVYNIELDLWDASGNHVYDEVMVFVVDTTPPGIIGPNDFTMHDTDTKTLTWTFTDLDPGQYTLHLNGTVVRTEEWDAGDLTYIIGFSAGVYNFTVMVADGSGNTATDTVIVTVLSTITNGTGEGPVFDTGFLLLVVGGGLGALVIIIVVIVRLRKG